MANYVQLNTYHAELIIKAMEYAKPTASIFGIKGSPVPEDFSGQIIENFKKRLFGEVSEEEADELGSIPITEGEIIMAYDSMLKYKKYLQSNLSRHKKGSADYNKTKKALDAIPRIMSTVFASVSVDYSTNAADAVTVFGASDGTSDRE